MQVRKFEARTMKEALEMVKAQMGPEAIILNARDNSKKYGLVGEGSVEVTAAVTEETLQKKKFVESRLRDQDRAKLVKSPAKVQKKVIEEMVQNYIEDQKVPKPITQRRYIEIQEDENSYRQEPPQYQESQRYANIGADVPAQAPPQKDQTIQLLKSEIENLKQVISNFKSVPQSMSTVNLNDVEMYSAAAKLPFELRPIFSKLTAAGMDEDIVSQLILEAVEQMPTDKRKNKSLVEAWVAKNIMTTTKISNEKDQARVQMFIGPSGSGKTASLIKLASHYVVNQGKKVAIATTDTFKVGAAEQLRIYAQILNVPFVIVRSGQEWGKILSHLSDYDYVLIDFPGANLKTIEEISKIKSLMPAQELNLQVHLVLTALAKDTDLAEIGKRYKMLQFTDVIFTGLDESAEHGNIYNFNRRFDVPLHSFGIGPRIPEDFETATKERVLDLIFKLSKMKKDSAADGHSNGSSNRGVHS